MKTTIVGARTRSLRENRNWSQEDLARESGLKRPHISLIETGDRMPGAETLVKLADTFGVSIDYLLGRSENPAVAPAANHPSMRDPRFIDIANIWAMLTDLNFEPGLTALHKLALAFRTTYEEKRKPPDED